MDSKSVMEVKRQNQILHQNVQRLYTICSELYREIHEIKRHTNYVEADGAVSAAPRNTAASNTLSDIEGFAQGLGTGATTSTSVGRGGRRTLKDINN